MIEEFTAIPGDSKNEIGKRLIDGIIVLDEPKHIQTGGKFDFTGKDIIVLQTKKERLGMYLMGQAFFSREIMKRYNPNSIKTVAICGKRDREMEAICSRFGIDVAVIDEAQQTDL